MAVTIQTVSSSITDSAGNGVTGKLRIQSVQEFEYDNTSVVVKVGTSVAEYPFTDGLLDNTFDLVPNHGTGVDKYDADDDVGPVYRVEYEIQDGQSWTEFWIIRVVDDNTSIEFTSVELSPGAIAVSTDCDAEDLLNQHIADSDPHPQYLLEDNVSTVSTANKVPQADGSGEIDPNWVPDATAGTKGSIQLAGDLTGTAASPQIAAGAVTEAETTFTNLPIAGDLQVNGQDFVAEYDFQGIADEQFEGGHVHSEFLNTGTFGTTPGWYRVAVITNDRTAPSDAGRGGGLLKVTVESGGTPGEYLFHISGDFGGIGSENYNITLISGPDQGTALTDIRVVKDSSDADPFVDAQNGMGANQTFIDINVNAADNLRIASIRDFTSNDIFVLPQSEVVSRSGAGAPSVPGSAYTQEIDLTDLVHGISIRGQEGLWRVEKNDVVFRGVPLFTNMRFLRTRSSASKTVGFANVGASFSFPEDGRYLIFIAANCNTTVQDNGGAANCAFRLWNESTASQEGQSGSGLVRDVGDGGLATQLNMSGSLVERLDVLSAHNYRLQVDSSLTDEKVGGSGHSESQNMLIVALRVSE